MPQPQDRREGASLPPVSSFPPHPLDAPSKTIPIVPAPAASATPEEVSLYEISRKIYPRAVHGWFAGWRWALVWLTQLVFYGLPWITWNDRQSVLFDLAARKFYVFGLVFWPQDVIYLTVLLIISAYSLFLFTAIAGRLWCGYACPQTVYTEIFLWVERRIEGDRVARMRLDGEPLSARKFAKKAAKHGAWGAIALWTGITFVGHENPPGVTTTQERVAQFLGSDRAPWYNLVNVTAHDHGGHFIPWEVPDAWVDDLRRTFRGRRPSAVQEG